METAHCAYSRSVKKHLKRTALPVVMPSHHLSKKFGMTFLLSNFSRPVSSQQRFTHKKKKKKIHLHIESALKNSLQSQNSIFGFQSFKAWIKFPQWLLSFFNSTLGWSSFHSRILLFSCCPLLPFLNLFSACLFQTALEWHDLFQVPVFTLYVRAAQ